MTTIRDIARIAGVAPSTVSHVLNGTAPVSLKTKARVQKVINEYHFQPNFIAKSLKQNRTFTIGVLTDNFMDFVPSMIGGIEEYLHQQNYSILISKIRYEYESEWDYTQLFNPKQIDGLIYASSWVREIQWKTPDIPHTYVYGYTQDLAEDYVIPNDFQGAFDATMHLITLRHNKIGFINGPIDWNASIERLNGFIEAHRREGLEIFPRWIKTGDWSSESGYSLAADILKGNERPTAIFAANDSMAAGVIRYCVEHGIRIPEELSLVGFDNTNFASILIPALTTVELPTFKMGKLAAKRLLENIQGQRGSGQKKKVDCKLIVRESTMANKH
ncbi:LacI family DNA-binding transcriptional regulator [Lederbergia wuyishanensis]|uniref:DNA-binding LacI/PurR family transcriptional regulator n=1 Tax=Lederbergia wuyishanensis TaxID=1347903 RepID=A0ABU0D9R2_9BACI|nr:LacI family DNA-binding transcriptional regulator [Lederbergia wuyishanensis]MCJ8007437.1 LacI family transcriptional regulator [Lederbergia wuyishanensis]MDQ0345125.1 DNA-binding LacI/PurR family transcriptional regulator [Lederbergia wuyishanensis]